MTPSAPVSRGESTAMYSLSILLDIRNAYELSDKMDTPSETSYFVNELRRRGLEWRKSGEFVTAYIYDVMAYELSSGLTIPELQYKLEDMHVLETSWR